MRSSPSPTLASATPAGRAFDDGAELAKVIKEDPRFIDCATRKLFTYALPQALTSDASRASASMRSGRSAVRCRGARMRNADVEVEGAVVTADASWPFEREGLRRKRSRPHDGAVREDAKDGALDLGS